MEALHTEANASGTYVLSASKSNSQFSLVNRVYSEPVALNEIKPTIKLRVKKHSVAQCLNLLLQAAFLILEVPFCLKNSASAAATLGSTAWSIMCSWTLQHYASLWPAASLLNHLPN